MPVINKHSLIVVYGRFKKDVLLKLMTVGVYKIYFKGNEKHFYIGSSKKIERRKQEHLNQLRSQRHDSKILSSAFKKYGETNFIFEVVEETCLDTYLKREQYYIDTLNPAYNIRSKVSGGRHYDYWIFSKTNKSFNLVLGLEDICLKYNIRCHTLYNAIRKKEKVQKKYTARRLTEEEYKLGHYIRNNTGYLYITYTFSMKDYRVTYYDLDTSANTIKIVGSIEEALKFRNKVIFQNKDLLEFIKTTSLITYMSRKLEKLSDKVMLRLESTFIKSKELIAH